MLKKLLVIFVLICICLFLIGCNDYGNGQLKIIVYDSQQKMLDDIYVALYNPDSGKRITFAYTLQGKVDFQGLKNKIYVLKVIGPQKKEKKLKINIEGGKTKIVKVKY